MKTTFPDPIPAIFGALALTTLLTSAQPATRAADTAAPPAAAPPQKSSARPRVDAVKAKEWDSISKVLPEVVFDDFPLAEVTKWLRDQFKNEFDVLLPSAGYRTGGPIDPNTGLPLSEAIDIGSVVVRLRLNNVNVSEIFNAMNLSFEIDRAPFHWDLTVNGSRPTAVLRNIEVPPPSPPPAPPPPAQPKKHSVFFIGDLVGSVEAGRLGVQQIYELLQAVCRDAFDRKPQISIHEAAQLLVVTGTSEEADLVREALTALKEKSKYRETHPSFPPPKAKLAEPKPQ